MVMNIADVYFLYVYALRFLALAATKMAEASSIGKLAW